MTTSDAEPIVLKDEPQSRPALLMMAVNALCNIRYKSMVFLFILFVLITSDVFISIILKKLSGAVDDHGLASPYGTVVQGVILVIGYMLINFLIDQGLI